MEAAKKEKNEHDYQSALSAFMSEIQFIDEPELIRTERLLRRARKLGILIPSKPGFDSPERDNDPYWDFNQSNGNWFLSDGAELELGQRVRKEESERFEHRWRRVTRFAVPIGSLMVGLAGILAGWNLQVRSQKLAYGSLVASNRPWMNAELRVVGPLAFTPAGANVPVTYKLTNVGHSPALNVWADVELYLAQDIQRDTEAERIRLCHSTITRSITMGQTVFPNSDAEGGMGTAVSDETVQRAAKYRGARMLNPAIIVCIAYQSTVENGVWHTTGLVYDLWQVNDDGIRISIPAGQSVPLARLGFSHSIFKGTVAN